MAGRGSRPTCLPHGAAGSQQGVQQGAGNDHFDQSEYAGTPGICRSGLPHSGLRRLLRRIGEEAKYCIAK